jgi:hypothetical protein
MVEDLEDLAFAMKLRSLSCSLMPGTASTPLATSIA